MQTFFLKAISFAAIFTLLLFATSSTAQSPEQKKIDSLLAELPKAKEDTTRVNLLRGLSAAQKNDLPAALKYGKLSLALAEKIKWPKGIAEAIYIIARHQLNNGDYDSAIFNNKKALTLFEQIKNETGIAKTLTNTGLAYMGLSDYPTGMEYFKKTLRIYTHLKDTLGIGKAYHNMGYAYSCFSDYSNALVCYQKSLIINEKLKDKQAMANILNNMGGIYSSLKNYPKSLEYYKRSLVLNKELDSKGGVALSLNNMGVVYMEMPEYNKASDCFEKALSINKQLDNKVGLALNYSNLGVINTKLENYSAALPYFQQSIVINERTGNKQNLTYDLAGVSEVYLSAPDSVLQAVGVRPARRYAMAIKYAQQALNIATEIGSIERQSDAWRCLSKIYEQQKNMPKALEAYKNYIVLRDSNLNEAQKQDITRKEMQFEFAKKQLADSLKDALAKKIADVKLQKQKNYTYGGFAGIATLLLFSIFVVRNYHNQKRSNRLLHIEKQKSETLLLNILPAEVAEELKEKGHADAKHFDDVTVLFTDFVNFSGAAEWMDPQQLVNELDTCFGAFDEIINKYNIEKIKTVGDAYLAVSGLPKATEDHAKNIVLAAIEIRDYLTQRQLQIGENSFKIRIGIHTGSVVAGIVGIKKFAYDIWGDTVNTAARMEQNSEAGKINISQTTYDLVKDSFPCIYRGEIPAKNKGMLGMYFIV